jgi:hypothetical protein
MSSSTSREASDPRRRDEETLDRELSEISGEFRMVVPGVTVLFGFLLSVPVNTGFALLSKGQQAAYFIAFLASAGSAVLMLAVSAYHRIRGKPYDKGLLVRTATRQGIAGMALLAVSLAAVVYLVTDLLYGRAASIPVTTALSLLVLGTWFALPLRRRLRSDC